MRPSHLRTAALAAALALGGCTADERPTMNPGVDCIGCHSAAADAKPPSAPDAPGQKADSLAFSAAGTVFQRPGSPASEGVKDVHILIYNSIALGGLTPLGNDRFAYADGGLASGFDAGAVEVVSNAAGNFYTNEDLLLDPRLHANTGRLVVELRYGGEAAVMTTHPNPADVYGPKTGIVGVGCNGCHSLPSTKTVIPDAPAASGCDPDAGVDPTLGQPCTQGKSCCSGFCANKVCATAGGKVGDACVVATDCGSGLHCVDQACAADPGAFNHTCSSGGDCASGYCVGGTCAGAPGRITIPAKLGKFTFDDGGYTYFYPEPE